MTGFVHRAGTSNLSSRLNNGEAAVHAGIESITALLAAGAEEETQATEGWRVHSEPVESRVVEYPCYYTLPAKNNISEVV